MMLCAAGNMREPRGQGKRMPQGTLVFSVAGTDPHEHQVLPACDSIGKVEAFSGPGSWLCVHAQLVYVISSPLSDRQVLFLAKRAPLPLLWLLWSRGINPLWRYLLVFAVRAVTRFPLYLLACGFWSLASQRNRPHVSLVISLHLGSPSSASANSLQALRVLFAFCPLKRTEDPSGAPNLNIYWKMYLFDLKTAQSYLHFFPSLLFI